MSLTRIHAVGIERMIDYSVSTTGDDSTGER